MEEVLKRMILENQEVIAGRKLIARNYSFPETYLITVLIGIRRCGKTHLLYEKAKTFDPDRILFLDEIQNLANWHLYLKRLHVKGYKIYVTGSNAHLISREIATFLKGRSLETTSYPFSFAEFLKLKNIELQPKDTIINQPKINHLFDEYLQ